MKHILMLEAMCWNERSWARISSHYGRAILVQHGFGFVKYNEWEAGTEAISQPPRRAVVRFSTLDEMTFGLALTLATFKDSLKILKGRRCDLVIGSANSLTLTGLFLRGIGRTKKVVCLVGDHFPVHGKISVRIYRRICGWLTKILARCSDEVWSISPRIPESYANPRNFVIPIWMDDAGIALDSRAEIGYIGIPSPDHAIDILFEICRKHNFRLNIIGDSPYLQSIKSSAPPNVVFHGIISDQAKISSILSRCFCGYAIYRNNSPKNYSYFGFPSKTLAYLNNNTPLVTTNIAHFMQDISKFGIGHVVEPVFDQIEKAILDLKNRNADFYEAINVFRKFQNAEVEKFHSERLTALLE